MNDFKDYLYEMDRIFYNNIFDNLPAELREDAENLWDGAYWFLEKAAKMEIGGYIMNNFKYCLDDMDKIFYNNIIDNISIELKQDAESLWDGFYGFLEKAAKIRKMEIDSEIDSEIEPEQTFFDMWK